MARFTDSEHATLAAAATSRKKPIGALVREIVLRFLGRRRK
jgi:hypothetical protein